MRPRAHTVAALLICLATAPAVAQELEPGVYANAPINVNLAVANYIFSTGNVLVDAALPIEGAHAVINVLGLGYVRTFNFFERSAKFDAQLPISWGTFEGVVAGQFRSRSPFGLADPRLRLSVNLIGSPALEPAQFAKWRQRTILGVSLQAVLPLGQYDADRVVNLGANRWSFRPEVGLSHRRNRWLLELAGGAWVFTDNDEYLGGSTLSQQPLYFAKGNVIYNFRPGLWLGGSYAYGAGGRTTVDSSVGSELQQNGRLGATLAVPALRQTSIKISYVSGVVTRLGGDFDSVGAAIQYSWR